MSDAFNTVTSGRAAGHVRRLLDAGMRPGEIAETAGISPTTVSQLTNGSAGETINIDTYSRLRKVPTPLRDTSDPLAWQDDGAACLGHPTEWWYLETANDGRPGGHDAESLADARRAVDICETCPVQAACLAYALDHEKFGIWGGLNANERRRLKRRQRDAGRP